MDWQTIMAIGGGIVLLGNVAAVLWKIISPGIRLRDTVGKNKEAIERLRRHEQNDFESLKDIRQIEKEQCRVMLVMLNHMIDGNGVESMKKTRAELEKLITEIDN